MSYKPSNIVTEFFVVIFVALVCGSGIGWLQCMIALRLMIGGYGLVLGALISMILTPFTYYFLLKKKINLKEFISTLSLCVFGGIISALVLGPLSFIVTPTILIVCGLYLHLSRTTQDQK